MRRKKIPELLMILFMHPLNMLLYVTAFDDDSFVSILQYT